MTHLPQKNVNSIQFEKRIVHVNQCLNLTFTDFEEKKPRGLFFFSRSQTHCETSELWNVLRSFRKSLEIVGSSLETLTINLQDKNLTRLAQKKLPGI